jgi:hypothetical protein
MKVYTGMEKANFVIVEIDFYLRSWVVVQPKF